MLRDSFVASSGGMHIVPELLMIMINSLKTFLPRTMYKQISVFAVYNNKDVVVKDDTLKCVCLLTMEHTSNGSMLACQSVWLSNNPEDDPSNTHARYH